MRRRRRTSILGRRCPAGRSPPSPCSRSRSSPAPLPAGGSPRPRTIRWWTTRTTTTTTKGRSAIGTNRPTTTIRTIRPTKTTIPKGARDDREEAQAPAATASSTRRTRRGGGGHRGGRGGGRSPAAAVRVGAAGRRVVGDAPDRPIARPGPAHGRLVPSPARRRDLRPAARVAPPDRGGVRGPPVAAGGRARAPADLDLLRSGNGGEPAQPRSRVPGVHGRRAPASKRAVRAAGRDDRRDPRGRPRLDMGAPARRGGDPDRARGEPALVLPDPREQRDLPRPGSGDRAPGRDRLARRRAVLPRVRPHGRRPAAPIRGRDGPPPGAGGHASGRPAGALLRALLLRGAAGGRRPRARRIRYHREPHVGGLDLHPGRERAPSGVHGRPRVPVDRRRARGPGGAGAAAADPAAATGVPSARPALAAATTLVDSAFAGVSTPSTHVRGSRSGSRSRVPSARRTRSETGRAERRPNRAEGQPEGGAPCLSLPGGSSSRQGCTSGTRPDAGTRRWAGTCTGNAPGSTSSTSRRP